MGPASPMGAQLEVKSRHHGLEVGRTLRVSRGSTRTPRPTFQRPFCMGGRSDSTSSYTRQMGSRLEHRQPNFYRCPNTQFGAQTQARIGRNLPLCPRCPISGSVPISAHQWFTLHGPSPPQPSTRIQANFTSNHPHRSFSAEKCFANVPGSPWLASPWPNANPTQHS